MGGEEDPMDRFGTLRRMKLDDLDDIDRHAGRQVLFNRVLGPLEHQRGEAERKMCLARAPVWPFAQLKHAGGGHWQTCDRLANRSALDHQVIVPQPGEPMGLIIWHPRPVCIEIAFAILNDGDHGCLGQGLLGRFGSIDQRPDSFSLSSRL
jgi:hypothetical protein